MSKERYQPERMVTVPGQIEVATANGKMAPRACKEAGVRTQIHHRQQHLSVGLAKLLDGFFGSLGSQLQYVIFSLYSAGLPRRPS